MVREADLFPSNLPVPRSTCAMSLSAYSLPTPHPSCVVCSLATMLLCQAHAVLVSLLFKRTSSPTFRTSQTSERERVFVLYYFFLATLAAGVCAARKGKERGKGEDSKATTTQISSEVNDYWRALTLCCSLVWLSGVLRYNTLHETPVLYRMAPWDCGIGKEVSERERRRHSFADRSCPPFQFFPLSPAVLISLLLSLPHPRCPSHAPVAKLAASISPDIHSRTGPT